MATWQGALIRVDDANRLLELARSHRIVLSNTGGPWALIDAAPQLGRLGPPVFARALSKALHTDIIAFFLQSTVSTERIEHWQNGELLRELEYDAEGGGWIAQSGTPQPWEGAYFFSDDEGTRANEDWPSNLGDEISPADIVRYEEARAKRTGAPVMDLLAGGSLHRLCAFYGVDPNQPAGRYQAPPNWRLRGTAIAIFIFIVGAFILGALGR